MPPSDLTIHSTGLREKPRRPVSSDVRLHEMSSENPHSGALDLLSHFLPRHVLRELREQALSFRRNELFRRYVLRRMWFVIPLSLVFVLIGSACAAGVIAFLRGLVAQPPARWFVVTVLCFGAAVWIASIVSQLYVLFAWLERQASRGSRKPDGRGKSSWWVLIAVFVALPMCTFALLFPQVALILIAVGVLSPIALSMFDR